MEGRKARMSRRLLRAADRADAVGWLLVIWPLSFFVYQELYLEGTAQLTMLEAFAYGLPAFSLPLLGYLVKRLAMDRKKISSTQQNLQNIIDNMSDLLMIIDKDKKIIFGNPALESYFGDIIGKQCREVFDEEAGCSSACPEPECMDGKNNLRLRSTLVLKNGQKKSFDINFSPFRDNRGKSMGIIEIWRDITLQLKLEKKLKKQALTDSLTKLQNSRSLFLHFPGEIKRALRQGYPLALVMLDIDHFKQYNDTYGHVSGDKVLKSLGGIISKHIRKNVDFGYRYGGDELILVLPHLDENEAKRVSDRISASFMKKGFPLVSLSLGIQMIKQDLSVTRILELADRAMYKAKSSGGNRIHSHGS